VDYTTLCDAKTLVAVTLTRPSVRRTPVTETFPVEKRAAKVPKQYLAAARDLDQKFHNSQRGEVGPIEAKLLEFEARNGPKPHAVVGFILGTFGELSNSCYSLCTAIARVGDAKKKSGRPSRKSPNAGNQTTEKNPVPDPAPAPALTKNKSDTPATKRISYTLAAAG
jgi:hypothetical protein